MRFTDTLDDLSECDLVAEAAIEDEDAKTAIFAALGKVVRPDALLTSNTSSIPIMKLAAVTPGPERVVGMHFFNPATVLPLVEVIPCELTSDETVQRVQEFAHDRLGKTIITAKDRAGFVVNALLIPYLLAAIRMVDAGLASAEDIDTAMVAGCAHPMGPLALADLIGLDTTARSRYRCMRRRRNSCTHRRPCCCARWRPATSVARPGGDSSRINSSPRAPPIVAGRFCLPLRRSQRLHRRADAGAMEDPRCRHHLVTHAADEPLPPCACRGCWKTLCVATYHGLIVDATCRIIVHGVSVGGRLDTS